MFLKLKSTASIFLCSIVQLLASDLTINQVIFPTSEIDENTEVSFVWEVENLRPVTSSEYITHVVLRNSNGDVVFEEDKWMASLPGFTKENVITNTSWIATPAGSYTLSLVIDNSNDIDTTNNDFIYTFEVIGVDENNASISGRVFFDDNQNAAFDETELGLNKWLIQLYNNGGQLIAETESEGIDLNSDNRLNPQTEFGHYSFMNLSAGTYTLKAELNTGLTITTPLSNELIVVLQASQAVQNQDFGFYAELVDFGDLPEPADSTLAPCPPGTQCYPTKLPNGARHVAVGAFLGTLRDTEPNGIPSDFANGDDTTGVNDEDGVEFLKFLPGVSGEVQVTVNGNPNDFPTHLAGFIDFDGDGLFNPFANETVVSQVINNAGTYNFTFSIPEEIKGVGYARFRLGTDLVGVFGPIDNGISKDGEVEDYVGLGFDYGDANRQQDSEHPYFPFGYPVNIIDDGARHIPTPTMLLGFTVTDQENDGQPGLFASRDNIEGREDEDGIEYLDGYQVYYSGTNPANANRDLTVYAFPLGGEISLKPLASQTGFINAWVDFNGDGDWDDQNEHIFIDEEVLSGPDYTTLSFTVPSDAKVGWTYVRYRFSSNMNLKPTGPAKDGEVEDYLIAILPRLDFGDAPSSYGTKLLGGGAAHSISDYFLGNTVDAELDGIASANAMGDDNNNLSDEDGVIFLDALSAGNNASVEVISNVPAGNTGYLSAWLDLDQSGTWEPIEKVIDDVELFGGKDTLSLSVPVNTESGVSYMRFRFTNTTDILPYNQYTLPGAITLYPGEVEDYIVGIDTVVTGVEELKEEIPTKFILYQNYPNPFNPSTTIKFALPETSEVMIEIYNTLGELISVPYNGSQSAGIFELNFDATSLSSGVYLYRMRAEGKSGKLHVSYKKMIILK